MFCSSRYGCPAFTTTFFAEAVTINSYCHLNPYFNRGFSRKALDAVALPWFTILKLSYHTPTTLTYLQRRVCALHLLPRTMDTGMILSDCGSGDVATTGNLPYKALSAAVLPGFNTSRILWQFRR